jgi:heat shock protein HspQ
MKTLAQIKKLPFVDELINEGEDGYWLYLKETYISEDTQCRTIHEHTVRELNEKLEGVKSIN